METVSIRLDNIKQLDFFGKKFNEDRSKLVRKLIDKGKKMRAIELYKKRKISIGLAARLAGMNISDFLDLLEEYNIKLNLTLDDAKLAMENAEKML